MKVYILYILSGAAGLMLRTGLSSLYGLPYTMNGRDIFNALLALVFVRFFSEEAGRLTAQSGG